jgi:hypothetical protein
MDATSNLSLPFIVAAQAQKHVTHNEALRALDAVVQLAVLDKDLAAPPGTPAEGDRYVVGPSPTGAWAGQAGSIAAFQDGAWAFYAPQEGWRAWVADEDRLYAWNGSAWSLLPLACADGAAIADENGNAQIAFHTAASAVNHIAVANAATGTAPQISAEGADSNIDLTLTPKGTGTIRTPAQFAVSSGSFPPLRMERTTGNTASVVGGEQLLATSSGNMADGFGVNMNFAIQDDAGVINEIGSVVFFRSGADNSGRFQIQPYNAGTATTRLEIAPGGNVYFPGVGTTASAANAVLNNGSSPANELLRSTSSVRYKTDIVDLGSDWKGIVCALRPITYRSKAPADNPALRFFGLIAEEVSAVDPRLVHYIRDADGKEIPEAVQYERLTVLLLKAVQELMHPQDAGSDQRSAGMSR